MKRGGVILAAVVLVGCGSVSAVQPDASVDGASDSSEADAVIVDAAIDAADIDAPRSAWAGPEPVLNLNTSGSSEFQPTIAGDGLELFFVRNSGGTDQGRLFTSTRSSRTAAWGVPTEITVAAGHLHPELSHDGLELYVTFGANVLRSTRATRSAPWGALQTQFAGISAATTSDGLSIYYVKASDGLVHVRRRASRGAEWGPEENPQTTTGIYNTVTINPEERYLLLNGATNGFAFPESASMIRVGSTANWSNFLEEPTIGTAKAQACDFVDDTEIYCSVTDAQNRHDIVRFTRR